MGSEAIDPCHILVAFLAVKISREGITWDPPFLG
jgi:hypothetical protein